MKNDLYSISSSKYDIYSKLLDIAAKGEYISPVADFDNIDFLKSSVFGYVTETLALLMRDSSFHKTMVYRENFLNTAIMPKSIYNWAKMFNVNVLDAVPSSRKAEISLDLNTIEIAIQNTSGSIESYKKKYGVVENGNFMIIDKSNPIIAGAYTFMLEHSIEIYRNKNGQYIVKYCTNEEDKTTEFGHYSNGGLITTMRKNVGDSIYLTFLVDVFQYKIVENSKIISGSSYLDTKVHQFPISGQLCGLSLEYSKSNVKENIELKFSNIEIQDDEQKDKKVAYYSIVDNNTLEISFLTNRLNGLPQAGGVLKLKTFVTEGLNGNINFNGEAVFLLKQDDIKSIPIMVQLSTSPMTAGLNQTSLGDIKGTIINKLSSRNTIITENDLNTWFASQSKFLESVNNSKITFKKEVDNLLKRTFSAYLLLRDGVALSEYFVQKSENGDGVLDGSKIMSIPSSYISSVVPTNTIDVNIQINPSDSARENIQISPNENIKYNFNTHKYDYVSQVEAATPSINDYIYKTPFIINLNKKYNILSYYYLEISDNAELEYYSVENKSNNLLLIPTSMDVFHQNNQQYIFTFYFTSDSDLTSLPIKQLSLLFDSTQVNIPTNDLSFVKIQNKEDNQKSKELHNTDEMAYNNYKLEIVTQNPNSIFNITENNENPQIELQFGKDKGTVQVYESTSIKMALELDSFSGMFKLSKPVSIFNALNDVMSSDVIMNLNENNKIISYTIKDVPVVAKYWIDSNINKKWFIKQLFIFINMLKSNLDKLETTTFFNIKFRNTYGISQYYTTTNTMIRLKLHIVLIADKINEYKNKLETGFNTQEALEREIIDFIRVAVDRSNQGNALVVSKIISQLQVKYANLIDHIDFLGLNGTYNQYVKSIMTETNDNQYPLEYFNLDNTIDENGQSRLMKDITFETI